MPISARNACSKASGPIVSGAQHPQFRPFRFRPPLRRFPNLAQQALHRRGLARHVVGQAPGGEVGITEQPGPFGPEAQDLADQRPVVTGTGRGAAGHPGPPGALAQVAPGGEGQEGLNGGPGQGDDVALCQAALARCFARRVAGEAGQAGEIGLGQHHLPGVLVVQHVLAEGGVQLGQADGELGHPGARRWPQCSATADQAGVEAFQQP
jgi:hypothetical protein